MKTAPYAIFALSDGSVFLGDSCGHGAAGDCRVGEAIFNTAMTGYQEIISDPSYSGQLINFTHPHIGNTGVNSLDNEASRIWARGVVARRICQHPQARAHWRASESLPDYLRAREVLAVDNVDTRAITRIIREQGALGGCIMIVESHEDSAAVEDALAQARAFGGLHGSALAEESSGSLPQDWTQGEWDLAGNVYTTRGGAARHVVVLDCGIKHNILRCLVARGCRVSVLPYDASEEAVRACNADGILISNGPGDPETCERMADNAKRWLAAGIPLFGLCLGHQIIAQALGAKTMKMKFGHHGANHPVRDEAGRVLITSQNHGFAVSGESLPPSVRLSHVSLFDGSVQGLRCDAPPVVTFQGHPEASPGPHEAGVLFDDFVKLIDTAKENRNA